MAKVTVLLDQLVKDVTHASRIASRFLHEGWLTPRQAEAIIDIIAPHVPCSISLRGRTPKSVFTLAVRDGEGGARVFHIGQRAKVTLY